MNNTVPENTTPTKNKLRFWIYDLLLVYVILVGAYFRFVGIQWGEEQYLHPDERFLVWVGSDISPVDHIGEYFDTANSSLNPHNRGHGFFVYGTLPLFMGRYLAEWIFGQSGFNEMTLVGRPLSATVDLLTLLLVYLVSARLYNRKSALLAAAFYACAVLPIQLSHFYKEDTFTNFFTFLAVYFAIRVMLSHVPEENTHPEFDGNREVQAWAWVQYQGRNFLRSPYFLLSVGFGIALGCAAASKLNTVPVAILLPAAFGLKLFSEPGSNKVRGLRNAMLFLILAAFVSIVTFRVFQPYAFSGPGVFGVKPNPQWVDNIREQRNQSTGDVDFPPALQWARRSKLFSFQNLVLWGMGLPLGILAWAGFLYAGWRMYKGDWQRHILLWGWTALYFIWQSTVHNPTMRYQLPVYPPLAIFAGWLVFEWTDRCRKNPKVLSNFLQKGWNTTLAVLTGGTVLLLTFSWAFAFTRIYTRPITRVAAARWIYQNVPGPINLRMEGSGGIYNQPIPFQQDRIIEPQIPYTTLFNAQSDGTLREIFLPHIVDLDLIPGFKTLKIMVYPAGSDNILSTAVIESDFIPLTDARGDEFSAMFDQPLSLVKGEQYHLNIVFLHGEGQITFYGSAPANESSWDDGLPLRMDGYDGYGGIYQGGLNFEMYWEDNTDKLLRFLNTMEQSDYLFISSNRQWGTTTRVPERYPLTIAYYQNLMGCPEHLSVIWCYNIAKPGMHRGNLGFDLVQVFESYPTLGALQINDQFAEEAFTVYDHPKVFVFKKSDDFNLQRVSSILGKVDLNLVKHVTPREASRYPGNLMLPRGRWNAQQAGGTWADLFNPNSLVNRSQFLSVLSWYFAMAIIGWIVYPMVRRAFISLPDRGYPFSRIAGLLILSYLVWIAGSLRVPFSSMTISLALLLLVVGNGVLFYFDRKNLVKEIFHQKRVFLLVEGIFLAFFLLDLLIRLGNPDLWHPWKGGEKPMDFAYLNAVLKSTSFPPYDPWYAGGYLNYYYYGFVLMGVLIKWLEITPAVAYNLILPSVFAMIAVGAFSLGWNLVGLKKGVDIDPNLGMDKRQLSPVEFGTGFHWVRFWSGLAGALGMALFGNLGSVRMIFQGFQKIAAPGDVIEGSGLFARWVFAFRGFGKFLSGATFPYGIGDWYWIPSRAIPAANEVEPITEFPFFTILYGDPHAHLFALPIALLVLAFALAVVLFIRFSFRRQALTVLFGALAIGALRPTNTWDYYPYLALGCIAIGYAIWFDRQHQENIPHADAANNALWKVFKGVLKVVFGMAILFALSELFFLPYTHWYGQGYNEVEIWKGTHTPFSAYFAHWGLFLFAIVPWMAWESREWMANTPVSALRKLEPYRSVINVLAILLMGGVIVLTWYKVAIAWFVLPVAAWAGVLILKPGQSIPKRFVLFLIGTGLMLTLMVEVIVLRGDIARMNTVFKFYLQVWTMFSVSAAVCFGWIIQALPRWNWRWRTGWQVTMLLLGLSAALYPMIAGHAKIKDRIASNAPHTLDGMAYMAYASYADTWGLMDLSQDYRAIRWMQENVTGSPVIVEANLRNLYRWGSRFSIYTGLPGVVGWEWHQQQQRALFPGDWVSNRIAEVEDFYLTTEFQVAQEFLEKYQVRYIIVGQQERGLYPGDGLEKFPSADGILWQAVYAEADTVIYEVIPLLSE